MFEFDLIGYFEILEEDVVYFLKKVEFDDCVIFLFVFLLIIIDSKFIEYYV